MIYWNPFLLAIFPLISPLVFVDPFIRGKLIVFHLLIFPLLTFFFIKLIKKRKFICRVPGLSGKIFLLFISYAALNSIFSLNYSGFLTCFSIFIIFIIPHLLPHIMASLRCYINYSALVIVVVCISSLFYKDLFFGHPHIEGAYLLTFFPFILDSALDKKNNFRFIHLLAFISFVGIFAEIPSLAQGGILFLFLFYYIFKLRVRLISFIVIIIPLLAFFIYKKGGEVLRSINERILLWQTIIDNIKLPNLFGVGLHRFDSFYSKWILSDVVDKKTALIKDGILNVEWAHNIFFGIYAELGVTGVSLVIFLIFSFIYEIINSVRKNERNVQLTVCSILILLAYSLVSFPLRMPSSGFAALILFAFYSSRSGELIIVDFNLRKSGNRHFLEILFFIIIFTGIFLGKEVKSSLLQKKGVSSRELSQKIYYLKQSYSYNPHDKITLFSLGKFLLDNGNIKEATYYLKKALKRNSGTPQLFAYAYALDRDGRREEAHDFFERLLLLDPEFKEIPFYNFSEEKDKKGEWHDKCKNKYSLQKDKENEAFLNKKQEK